jgi:nitroreductase
LSKEATLELLKAAIQAPSGGNCQPWKFVVRNNTISVFHDRSLSHSFLDFNHLGSYIGLGASIENIYLKSEDLGLQAIVHNQIGDNQSNNLVAIISFKKLEATTIDDRLIQGIFLRHTNRNLGPKFKYNSSHYQSIKEIMNNYLGSEIDFVVDDSEMKELGDILATAEKLVLMHPRGHYDAFHRELRWNEEETESTMDGLDVSTLGLTEGEVAAMRIAHDRRAMEFLRETIKGGDALKKMSTKAVACSSALAVISMPSYSAQMFLDGGRAVERFWIAACMEGIAVQPIAQFVFVLTRLLYGSGNEMNDEYKKEFSLLKNRFYKLLPTMNDRQPVFIFRLSKAEEPEVKSLRKPIDSVSIFC